MQTDKSNIDPHTASETKRRIFTMAAQLFSEKGFNGVSMRELSERSGVSKPTIYYYFENKANIYTQLVDTGMDHIFRAVEQVRHEDRSSKDKLVAITQSFFETAHKQPEFVKFFLRINSGFEDIQFLEKLREEADSRGKALTEIIREGIRTGEFGTSVKPDLAANIIGGVIRHFVWKQLATSKKILNDKLAQDIIDTLFKGLNE